MKKFLILAALIFTIFAAESNAQNRKSVGAAEVNGTYRLYYSGKFKGDFNEINILALGDGKLRVDFYLIYPFIDGTGGLMVNRGDAEGTAFIEGDTATFTPPETEGCTITIKFVKRGTIRVSQEGVNECGFGLNVNSQGTYKKTSGAKPKFNANEN